MSELLREVLSERAAVAPPVFDAAGLVARAERARRRRLVSVAAVVVAAAVAAGGLALAPRLVEDPAPVDRPARFTEPRLTYVHGGAVHYGDRSFDTDVRSIESVARTPYGFVLGTRLGAVWFSDGSVEKEVGGQLIVGGRSARAVTADPTGPWAAWVEAADDGSGELVVFDSRRGEVVARVPGRPDSEVVAVVAVVDEAVYWTRRPKGSASPLLRYDIATREQDAVELPAEVLVLDVAEGGIAYWSVDHRPYQVTVESPRAGSTTDVEGLSPEADLSPDASYLAGLGRVGLRVFDVATGHPIRLRPPRGYGIHQFMGWIDRSTLAVWDADRYAILTCATPSGSCRVAVQDPGDPGWQPLFPGYRPG